MRLSFLLNSNNTTINLNKFEKVKRAKLTKLRFLPDNITTNMICIQVDGLNMNQIISSSIVSSYFFMIPFVNNNSIPYYSNDLNDTWDFVNENGVIINKFVIRITN